MMYWYGNGTGGWGYALMAIGMVLFWGAVIFGIAALVRCARRDGPRYVTAPSRPHPDRSGCSPSDSPAARSTRTSTTSASQACAPRARQRHGDVRTPSLMRLLAAGFRLPGTPGNREPARAMASPRSAFHDAHPLCCHIPMAGISYTTTPGGYMEIRADGTGGRDLRPLNSLWGAKTAPTASELQFPESAGDLYAACSYSLISPPRIPRR